MSIGFEAILKYFWKIPKISGTLLGVPLSMSDSEVRRSPACALALSRF